MSQFFRMSFIASISKIDTFGCLFFAFCSDLVLIMCQSGAGETCLFGDAFLFFNTGCQQVMNEVFNLVHLLN